MSAFSCEFCGKPVSPQAVGTSQFSKGWTERREGGRGGLRLVEYEDRFAHGHCVESAVHGRIRGQQDLLSA